MANWIDKLGQVLTMNEKNILDHAGKISHKLALEKAEGEYSKYIELQRNAEHLESIIELDKDIKALRMPKS